MSHPFRDSLAVWFLALLLGGCASLDVSSSGPDP